MLLRNLEKREYQSDTVRKVLEHFAEGKESIMLESPVGSGKTVMGLMVIKALQDTCDRRLRVNWVASRRHILEQTQKTNEAWFGCDINLVSVFATNPPKADFVVLDEAHHEATQSCIEMYERTGNPKTLGLSATPLRTDKMRLSFQKTVQCYGIQKFINMGVLSEYQSWKIPEWRPELVAQIFCESQEQWGRSLVFFRTVDQCAIFKKVLHCKGIGCEVVTAKSNRDAQLDAFLDGAVQVIANVSVLTEGFDLPELQTVFVRDASRLPTIQMVGRGLRRSPEKAFCNIVQSGESKFPAERIAKPIESFRYMKNTWRSCSGDTIAVLEAIERTQELLKNRKTNANYRPVNIVQPSKREVSLRFL